LSGQGAAPGFFIATVAPSGEQFDAWASEPLLISAELGGINWPSSCRNGTCRTCIAQLTQGHVSYSIDWPGLTPEEKEQGYVLPCVALPQSDISLLRMDT
jgi:ferredoxin